MHVDLLEEIINKAENEHLECKEAKNRYDFEKLVKYCCALANEGGGKMVLGVSDKQPRQVVGTKAFSNLEKTKPGQILRLKYVLAPHLMISIYMPLKIFAISGLKSLGMRTSEILTKFNYCQTQN